MVHRLRSGLIAIFALVMASTSAHAIEARVSAPALERTLKKQLFNEPGPDGKSDSHYIKGSLAKGGCYVYVDDPHVTFKDDRVVVTVKTHDKLGVGKTCFGF